MLGLQAFFKCSLILRAKSDMNDFLCQELIMYMSAELLGYA
jgi:hypothetical protein